MKIMIFGALASGKSTFARKLGDKLKIPVIHLDEEVHKLGGHRHIEAIEQYVKKQAEKDNWIMDGNILGKDPYHRIKHADIIIQLRVNPFESVAMHIYRHALRKMGRIKELQNNPYQKLDLWFCINYVFWQFPYLSYTAQRTMDNYCKRTIDLRGRRQAQRYIDNFGK